MGQRANNNRNASLDDKKRRMAGREEKSPEVKAIHDFQKPELAKGHTGGAHGEKTNRKGGGFTRGGGGGGGAPAPAKASHLTVGRKKS